MRTPYGRPVSTDPDDDAAWWAAQPDVGPYYMDVGDAAGWLSESGWFDPIDAELDQLGLLGDDQLDLSTRLHWVSPLSTGRPWVSPLTEPPGCLILFAGERAGDNLAWMHGGLAVGEAGGWWVGDEELIEVARRIRARIPDDLCAVAFVISMICETTDDTTSLFADEYRSIHGTPDGAVTFLES